MNDIRVIVVDDERLARAELVRLLTIFDDVEVLAEAENGTEALRILEQHTGIDLVFLDIDMPGINGLSLATLLKDSDSRVVFCTAYSEHAVKAFELNSLDYLTKPVAPERLAQCLERYRHALPPPSDKSPTDMHAPLMLHDGDKVQLVTLNDIEKLTSIGNYVLVRGSNIDMMVLGSLSNLEKRLDPRYFFRANRQCIVNLRKVTKSEVGIKGGYSLRMETGDTVEVSRRQSQNLKRLISL